jgi:hypothetical protein
LPDLDHLTDTRVGYRAIENPAAEAAAASQPTDAPFYKTANSVNKPMQYVKGQVWEEKNFGWWGNYVDDGPQTPNEDLPTYRRRVFCARDNMRIERRLKPALPPKQPNESRAERAKATAKLLKKNEERAENHNKQMSNDAAYREDFQKLALEVHGANNMRRRAALKYRNDEVERLTGDAFQNLDFNPPQPNTSELYEDWDADDEPLPIPVKF